MARFAKLNKVADRMMARMDELGDEAVQAMRSTPEALARQAESAAKMRKAAQVREAKHAKAHRTAVAANAFVVGQTVRSAMRMGADYLEAMIVAVEGSTITLDNGRKFAAAKFVAA